MGIAAEYSQTWSLWSTGKTIAYSVVLFSTRKTMKRNIIDAGQLELEDKVVSIKRVTKVVKGGRFF